MHPKFVIISAVARNGVIGYKGGIPWHIPQDFKHFKSLTMGKTIVMGKKTFESLPGLLPDRKHVVISSTLLPIPQVDIYSSIDAFLLSARSEYWIIGGQGIYQAFMPLAERMHITHVHRQVEGDTYFPTIGREWLCTEQENFEEYSFCTYIKIKS
ncbi:MAG: dihydrofolate reductase [Candidatus Woesearchaeota archaeon]